MDELPVRARTLRWPLLCAIVLASAWLTTGCDKVLGDRPRIDAEWHRQALVEGLLARWLEAAPTPSGFMRTGFDRHWKADAAQTGALTEHARLVYSFVNGYEVTQDKRYLAAATKGADFLLAKFHDPVHGGFFLRVGPDGSVVHDNKNLYGHSFALLALSHMARVTQEPRFRDAALRTWKEIDLGMRDPGGGFRGELGRDFSQSGMAPAAGGSQNPIMHLFEALLALHDATADPAALAGAKGVADFALYRLLVGLPDGSAYIPEWYGPGWKPASADKGGYTDVGHQFEWIHMLLAAEQRGLAGVYGPTSERLLKFALAKGYDDNDGGSFTRVDPDGTVARGKYWWQQCEAIRAFLAVASAGNQPDMWRRYEQTLTLVREQFIDRENGGWYRQACKGGGCAGPQVEPYHMTGMHQAALRLAAPSR
ncbi:MAG: AGE family epimerase/isomerase [Burkholderiales bacterium]